MEGFLLTCRIYSVLAIFLSLFGRCFLEVAIKFRDDCDSVCIAQFARQHRLQLKGEIIDGFHRFGGSMPKGRRRRRGNVEEEEKSKFEVFTAEKLSLLRSSSVTVQVELQRPFKREKRSLAFSDPFWSQMWYINEEISNITMNVEKVWEMGYTGRGIVVSMVDDGIETSHPELKDVYDPNASYDFVDQDSNPKPEYPHEERHGTRSAGIVAAAVNNSNCGVGIAFNANVGGIRAFSGAMTDSLEAQSFGFKSEYIDIYSIGWGVQDNGIALEGPGKLTLRALQRGIEEGRQGKGSLYVVPSGNGGLLGDTCSCDGYINSPYIIAVSSLTRGGRKPWYGEKCPAILAVTFSGGLDMFQLRQLIREHGSIPDHLQKFVVPDPDDKCSTDHCGSSVSAPVAAAIIALALEANSALTWRDVQHLLIRTSRTDFPDEYSSEWQRNGAGRKFSHWFGFGLMDAEAFVSAALDWRQVPDEEEEIFPVELDKDDIDWYLPLVITIPVIPDDVIFCEHVIVELSLSADKRGDNEIQLTSPNGTTSELLSPRARDEQPGLLDNWSFMSVHFWGENPNGDWELKFKTRTTSSKLKSLTLKIRGTKSDPQPKRK